MKDIKRLTKDLELVRLNAAGTTGELKAFWLREEKKTAAKIASVSK